MEKELTRTKCRDILAAAVLGEDLGAAELDFMLAILALHPEAAKKIGPGVKKIWVQVGKFQTRGFWLERVDGTRTDWSFTRCFIKVDDFKRACRAEIDPQIWAFRAKDNTPNGFHADHHPESFDSILSRFVAENGKTKVELSSDGKSTYYLLDRGYAEKWKAFHLKHARLRSIPAKENLRKKNI